MQKVIQVNNQKLKQMAHYYSQFSSKKVPTGALFSISSGSATVTGYYSGKVMFQGKTASAEAASGNQIQFTVLTRLKKWAQLFQLI